jgi:hypothetical protein
MKKNTGSKVKTGVRAEQTSRGEERPIKEKVALQLAKAMDKRWRIG